MHLVGGVVAYKVYRKTNLGPKKKKLSLKEESEIASAIKSTKETIVVTFSDILKRSRDYQDKTIK